MIRPAQPPRNPPAGFTLIEVIIVLGIVALFAAIVVPSMTSGSVQSLEAVARKLSADLRLARSLAVQTGSDWSVQFDVAGNSYEVLHTGAGSVPTLRNPLAAAGQEDGPYQVALDGVTAGGATVQQAVILGVALQQSRSPATDVTFNSQGGTGPLRSEDTVIWIGERDETGARYVRITLSWITGQVWIDPPQLYDATNLDLLYD